MNLFQAGRFNLHSGKKSGYKIECDALTPEDWAGVAAMIAEEKLLPPFSAAEGVPTGGVPFARAMCDYATGDMSSDPILICEDVVTTGGSMERYRRAVAADTGRPVIGICLFARGPCPGWITPVFRTSTTDRLRSSVVDARRRRHASMPRSGVGGRRPPTPPRVDAAELEASRDDLLASLKAIEDLIRQADRGARGVRGVRKGDISAIAKAAISRATNRGEA